VPGDQLAEPQVVDGIGGGVRIARVRRGEIVHEDHPLAELDDRGDRRSHHEAIGPFRLLFAREVGPPCLSGRGGDHDRLDVTVLPQQRDEGEHRLPLFLFVLLLPRS
jgi:hypothetical protein